MNELGLQLHTKDLSGLSVLVTGGAGFIGSHLVEYLVTNGAKKVIVLDDLATGFGKNIDPFRSSKNFAFIQGSITQYETCLEACRGIDVVLHHAALGSVPRSIENPIRTNEVNINGFVNILFAAKECKVKKFIYASSSSVYGDNETSPKVESRTGNLLSPYAVTKHANEKYARVFSELYKIQTMGLRYFNVFGERQNPEGAYAAVIPKFISALLENRLAGIYGTGNNTRDFTYVANVVKANLLCLESESLPLHSVMNVACGGTISVNEIYRLIAKQLGREGLKPQHLPERPGEIKNSYADISLAIKLLGYKPVVSLRDGLEKTVKWFNIQAEK